MYFAFGMGYRIHHPYSDAEYEGTVQSVHFCRVSCKLSESFELTYFLVVRDLREWLFHKKLLLLA